MTFVALAQRPSIIGNSQLAAEHPEKPHLDEDNSAKPTQASDKAAQAEILDANSIINGD
jgi:hypothetical protein